jgi:uncharacterized membrane protein
VTIRSLRERIFQALCYEAGGIVIVTPAYGLIFGRPAPESLALIVALSIAFMIWASVYNTIYDIIEFRLARRVASDRPHLWRGAHAILHDVTGMIVTIPIILMMTDHGFWTAVAIDVGLTLFYTAYAYVFYLAFDWWRPVGREPSEGQPD